MSTMGDEKQFKSSAKRMIGGIIVGCVVMILLTLILLFGDIKISLMILFSIPLTLIGASWTLLFLNYHVSMPAMMGFSVYSLESSLIMLYF